MDFAGILGGFLAERAITHMSFGLYFTRAFSLVEFQDFIPATMKTTVFGLIIGSVAVASGIRRRPAAPRAWAQASTRSVVLASILIIATNVVLVRLIFFLSRWSDA